MADLLKKKLWGFNVVGAQGVNAKNDIEVGVTGNMGVYYDGLPAIRVGNRLFTPVGNVIEGEGEDEFIPEEQIPDIPEDAIEDGVNYILGLDDNAEVAWIKFPNLPEDFDEKNYVLALDSEGEMIWKEETGGSGSTPAGAIVTIFAGGSAAGYLENFEVTVGTTTYCGKDTEYAGAHTFFAPTGETISLNDTSGDLSIEVYINGEYDSSISSSYTVEPNVMSVEIRLSK